MHESGGVLVRRAQLLKRVFDIDIKRCPHCGGQLREM